MMRKGMRRQGAMTGYRALARGVAAAGACVALLLPGLAAANAATQGLERDFAPGTIVTRADAERALTQARAVQQRLQGDYEAQAARCDQAFFVNRCMLAARRQRRDGEAAVHRVTLEAHDLQRGLDAQEHAQARAAEQRHQAQEDLQRPERERLAAANAQERAQAALDRARDEQLEQQRAARDSAAGAARQQAQQADRARQDAQRPRQEAASQREYQVKQKDAVGYAAKRALDRDANAKRRAERQKARDAQTAADQAASAARVAAPVAPAH